jgi:hypothetical protein
MIMFRTEKSKSTISSVWDLPSVTNLPIERQYRFIPINDPWVCLFSVLDSTSSLLEINQREMTARDQIRAMLDQLMGSDSGMLYENSIIKRDVDTWTVLSFFFIQSFVLFIFSCWQTRRLRTIKRKNKTERTIFVMSLLIDRSHSLFSIQDETVPFRLTTTMRQMIVYQSHLLSLNAVFLAMITMNMSMLGSISFASIRIYKLKLVSIWIKIINREVAPLCE